MIKVDTRWVYSGNIADDLDAEIAPVAKEFLKEQGEQIKAKLLSKLDQQGSGRLYRSKRGDGTKHRASAPGEPPAPDTGDYRDSISVRVVVFKFVYRLAIESRLWRKFGRRLELGGYGGGVYIAPRPHIRPVVQEVTGVLPTISSGDAPNDDVG